MKRHKKILSILIKIIVGAGSFAIIYFRLENDLTSDRISVIGESVSSASGLSLLALVFLMIPLNWGLESCKWQLITAPVEKVSYRTASRSVYAGTLLGNLAPGKATEFIGRIIFFYTANRPKITILHFVNGMFQLSITIIAGFFALGYQLRHIAGPENWLIPATITGGVLLMGALTTAIVKINYILNKLTRWISKKRNTEHFQYHFTGKMISRLFLFSALRYLVFFSQFALMLYIFSPYSPSAPIFAGIALYFLVTSLLPTVSIFEAAVRAAVALLVFQNSGIDAPSLALTSVLVWLFNIVLPSVAGYYFLLKQNFNFKLYR